MRKIIAFISFVCFIIICILISNNNIVAFDNYVYSILTNKMTEEKRIFFRIITEFGGAFIVPLITVILVFTLKNKKIAYAILLNFVLIVLLNQGMKFMIRRPRPEINQLVKVSGYSFPSGHSMISTAFYGYLIHLIYRHVKSTKLKVIGSLSLTILILLIMTSRVYLGVHYASDTIAGMFFSIAYLKLYTEWITHLFKKKEKV